MDATESTMREREERTGPELIKAAAEGKLLSDTEQSAALEWFLSEESEDQEPTRVIEINVGSPKVERWVPWEIRPVDLDMLRRIRRASQGSRAQRRAGTDQIDEIQANLRIVVEGTVNPDLAEAAQRMRIADPATALQQRFARKPGLLGQIAAEIMSLSGYDDEDVRDAQAAKT